MNDQTITTEQSTIVATDRTTAVSTVGYMCIAVTWWMLGMLMTGWFSPAAIPAVATSNLYAVGSILLVIVGILAVVYGRHTLDAIIFLGMAGLLFTLHLTQLAGTGGGGNMAGYDGWYALVWAVFFCYLWISSLQPGTGTFRVLFLLLFWLGALAAAIGGWINSIGIEELSGYLILISAVLSMIVSAKEVLGHRTENLFGRKKVTVTSASPPPHPAL